MPDSVILECYECGATWRALYERDDDTYDDVVARETERHEPECSPEPLGSTTEASAYGSRGNTWFVVTTRYPDGSGEVTGDRDMDTPDAFALLLSPWEHDASGTILPWSWGAAFTRGDRRLIPLSDVWSALVDAEASWWSGGTA